LIALSVVSRSELDALARRFAAPSIPSDATNDLNARMTRTSNAQPDV